MQCILRLATMEVKNKLTYEISLFWKLFSEILSQITERDYPKALMMDENGINCCAIRQVFDLNFTTTEVVSCQMQYRNDINEASFRIGASFRDSFKSICYEMCTVATMA